MAKPTSINEDLIFQSFISENLSRYPNLKSLLPGNYPAHGRFRITLDQMQKYHKSRAAKDRGWMHMNIPTLLYTVAHGTNKKLIELCHSFLDHFELFAKEFSSLPGAKDVILPLCTQGWDLNDPRMWSIAAECYFPLLLKKQGIALTGFGQKISGTTKDADLQAIYLGKKLNLDVLAGYPNEIKGSKDDFRLFIEKRAKDKIKAKFSTLPKDEFGAVALVFVAGEENFKRFIEDKEATAPVFVNDDKNPFGQVYWIVGSVNPDTNKFGFMFVDKNLPMTASISK